MKLNLWNLLLVMSLGLTMMAMILSVTQKIDLTLQFLYIAVASTLLTTSVLMME